MDVVRCFVTEIVEKPWRNDYDTGKETWWVKVKYSSNDYFDETTLMFGSKKDALNVKKDYMFNKIKLDYITPEILIKNGFKYYSGEVYTNECYELEINNSFQKIRKSVEIIPTVIKKRYLMHIRTSTSEECVKLVTCVNDMQSLLDIFGFNKKIII